MMVEIGVVLIGESYKTAAKGILKPPLMILLVWSICCLLRVVCHKLLERIQIVIVGMG